MSAIIRFLLPYFLVAAVSLLIGIKIGSWWVGIDLQQANSQLVNYSTQASLSMARQQDTIVRQRRVTKNQDAQYESDISTLRAYYNAEFERLRKESPNAKYLPSVPDAFRGADEAMCYGLSK